MNRIKQILKVFFVFVLPMTLVFNFFLLFITYDAHYYYQGNKCEARFLGGFPFLENGLFFDINSMATSGNSTTNWMYYFLNKIIILIICFLIYFFLLRKLSFIGRTKIFILALMTIIYMSFGWMTFKFTSMQIIYDYGVWPDKLEIDKTYLKNPF